MIYYMYMYDILHVHVTKGHQPTAPVLKAGHPVSYSFVACLFVSWGGGGDVYTLYMYMYMHAYVLHVYLSFFTGPQVKTVFQASGLTQQQLAQIW